jgi:hypothetical protein
MDRLLKWNKFESKLVGKIYGPDIHREFRFTQPNDNFTIRKCCITFPDEVSINFDASEKTQNDADIDTFKLSINQNNQNLDSLPMPALTSIFREYLSLYGDKIQFEDYNEYHFIRTYLNKEDLFETTFNGYIYSDEKLGCTDVEIKITKDQSERNLINSGIFKNGLQPAYYCLSKSILLVKDKKDWRNFISQNHESIMQEFIDPISEMEINDGIKSIIPVNVKFGNIGLIEYLYLYGISNGFKKEISYILNRFSSNIETAKVLSLLYDIW